MQIKLEGVGIDNLEPFCDYSKHVLSLALGNLATDVEFISVKLSKSDSSGEKPYFRCQLTVFLQNASTLTAKGYDLDGFASISMAAGGIACIFFQAVNEMMIGNQKNLEV